MNKKKKAFPGNCLDQQKKPATTQKKDAIEGSRKETAEPNTRKQLNKEVENHGNHPETNNNKT